MPANPFEVAKRYARIGRTLAPRSVDDPVVHIDPCLHSEWISNPVLGGYETRMCADCGVTLLIPPP